VRFSSCLRPVPSRLVFVLVLVLARKASLPRVVDRANERRGPEHHLYTLVAAHLRAHPATEASPLRLRIAGMAAPEKLVPPAVPRGWKVGSILPLHSPAMSGGGVSENFLKEMMQEMQGQQGMVDGNGGGGGGGGGSGAEGKRKKEKKKGKV